MRRGLLILLSVLAVVAVGGSASASTEQTLHFAVNVTLSGSGTGNVYGCGPGFNQPACFNAGVEDPPCQSFAACAWQATGVTTEARDTTNPHSGNASLQLTANSSVNAQSFCLTPTTQGNKAVSAWYRTNSPATQIVVSYAFNAGLGCDGAVLGTPFIGTVSPVTNGTWTQLSGTVAGPSGTNSVRILLSASCPAACTVNFDDFTFQGQVDSGTVDCSSPNPGTGRCGDSGGTFTRIQNDTNFTFIATANPGSTFTGWTGSSCFVNPNFPNVTCTPCSGTDPVCTLNQQEGVDTQNIVANFGTPTLVTMRSLHAARTKAGIAVRWRTAADAGVLGFNVYRENQTRSRIRLNRGLIPVTSGSAGHAYRFVDRHAPAAGTLRYWIEEVDVKRHDSQWYGPIAVRLSG
jgi:hypothetical protein